MKKTSKAVLFGCMLMAASVFFTAQKTNAQGSMGELRGTIYEDSTEKVTLPGATVYVMVGDEMVGTATDIDGKFVIKPLSPGLYTLTISSTGRIKASLPVEVKPNIATYENHLVLVEQTNTLGDVEITATREPLINPEETSVQSLSYKEIENNPNLRNTTKLLQTITTEVVVNESTGDAYVRGGRSDASVYFLDGVKMDNIGRVPGVAIGNVTVYTGGVPAKYGDTTSGVVILETKSYFDMYNDWQNEQRLKGSK